MLTTWEYIRIVVLLTFSLYVGYILLQYYQRQLADLLLERANGCQLPPELPKRWPLGVDRIKELWDSNSEGRLLAFLCSIAKDYEPRNNLYQHLLIGPRAFHVLHPTNVKALLSTNYKGLSQLHQGRQNLADPDEDYGLGCRPAVFAPLLGNGISTQEGATWKHSRELLRKQFVRAQYRDLHHLQEHVNNLIEKIGSGGILDLQPLFFELTMDIATAVLFKQSVYSLRASTDQSARNREFAESFDIAQEGLAKRLRLAPFHFFYNPASFRKACKKVHLFVDEYLNETRLEASDQKSSWFIDQLTEASATDAELRHQLLNILLAGRDTTACCLSWTFRLLVRHPQVLSRLREEISSIMDGQSPSSRDQIKKMHYLSCVIKESLRLYPPVPLNNREATKSTILPTGGGPNGTSPMLVRRGELVVISQYVNSRKKNIYGEDAEEFRPERWETGELDNVGWAYFPFSGGPRQCLGEDFAIMEVSYTVVRLLQRYPEIKLPSGENDGPVGTERQRLTLVLSCAEGCNVEIRG